MLVENKLNIKVVEWNDPNWNYYVDSIGFRFVFYHSEYLSAFTNNNSYTPIMFVYENDDDKAICVEYKRDISFDSHLKNKIDANQFFDLISPYGYGGYVGKVNNKNLLMKNHQLFCKEKGFVSEVIKFHPLSDFISFYKGIIETPFHNVVCDLTVDNEDIWMNFKHKVRKNVNHANNSGVSVTVDYSGKFLDDFLRIYYSTMKRNSAEDSYYFSREFFENINSMKTQVVYFHSLYENKIISTELVIYDDICCYSYLGGTDENYYNLRPNDLLKYEIIKWGKTKGLKYFVLGGGHGSDDGIYQYKTALSPNGIRDFCIGTDIFSEDKYNLLCNLRKENDPFFCKENKRRPAYRF